MVWMHSERCISRTVRCCFPRAVYGTWAAAHEAEESFDEPFGAHVLPLRDDIDSDDGNPDGNPGFGPLPDPDHSLRRQAKDSGSHRDWKTSRPAGL